MKQEEIMTNYEQCLDAIDDICNIAIENAVHDPQFIRYCSSIAKQRATELLQSLVNHER